MPPACQLGPCRTDQAQGARKLFAVAAERLFLKGEDGFQPVRAAQNFADPRQGQAQAFEGDDLVQSGDLGRAIDPPTGAGTLRRQQAALFIEAQRLDAGGEQLGGLGRAEMTIHAGLILSTSA